VEGRRRVGVMQVLVLKDGLESGSGSGSAEQQSGKSRDGPVDIFGGCVM